MSDLWKFESSSEETSNENGTISSFYVLSEKPLLPHARHARLFAAGEQHPPQRKVSIGSFIPREKRRKLDQEFPKCYRGRQHHQSEDIEVYELSDDSDDVLLKEAKKGIDAKNVPTSNKSPFHNEATNPVLDLKSKMLLLESRKQLEALHQVTTQDEDAEDGCITLPDLSPVQVGRAAAKRIAAISAAVQSKKTVEADGDHQRDGTKICLKLQCSKGDITVRMRPSDIFHKAFEVFMESAKSRGWLSKNATVNDLVFYFDGDLVSQNQTPEEIELEGDEVIEVHWKQ